MQYIAVSMLFRWELVLGAMTWRCRQAYTPTPAPKWSKRGEGGQCKRGRNIRNYPVYGRHGSISIWVMLEKRKHHIILIAVVAGNISQLLHHRYWWFCCARRGSFHFLILRIFFASGVCVCVCMCTFCVCLLYIWEDIEVNISAICGFLRHWFCKILEAAKL